MSDEPPIEPRPIKRRKTKYMKLVERNAIREMLQAGMSQTLIAQKRNYTDRQIRNYVSDIRREDYQTLMSEDQEARASAIQEAKINLSRLRARMLQMLFEDENVTNSERIGAAEMARQFELDLVNLRLNGPVAIGLRVLGNATQGDKRLPSRSQSAPENNLPDTQGSDSSVSNGEPTDL